MKTVAELKALKDETEVIKYLNENNLVIVGDMLMDADDYYLG